MAIMWEPPKTASIRPSLAELAWRLWLANCVKDHQPAKCGEEPHASGHEPAGFTAAASCRDA